MASMLEVSTHRATEAIRVNDTTPVEGWSELLLALPEFVLAGLAWGASSVPSLTR